MSVETLASQTSACWHADGIACGSKEDGLETPELVEPPEPSVGGIYRNLALSSTLPPVKHIFLPSAKPDPGLERRIPSSFHDTVVVIVYPFSSSLHLGEIFSCLGQPETCLPSVVASRSSRKEFGMS